MNIGYFWYSVKKIQPVCHIFSASQNDRSLKVLFFDIETRMLPTGGFFMVSTIFFPILHHHVIALQNSIIVFRGKSFNSINSRKKLLINQQE